MSETEKRDSRELLYIQHTNLAKIRVMQSIVRDILPGEEAWGMLDEEAREIGILLRRAEARLEKRV